MHAYTKKNVHGSVNAPIQFHTFYSHLLLQVTFRFVRRRAGLVSFEGSTLSHWQTLHSLLSVKLWLHMLWRTWLGLWWMWFIVQEQLVLYTGEVVLLLQSG